MEEKRYLKWYNMVGYGSGDIAGNVVYAFLSSFVMIYLTNTVGLNAGVVGTLIAVSKLFDGVTDIFFGTMIDRTKSKMGKARPWMFYGFFGCALTLFGVFAIPTSLGRTAQYAWFFIAYTLLNAVFYTANNIAYSALTTLVTKNSQERVQMGSFRFMFSFGTALVIQSITVGAVDLLGGGAAGWRNVAFVYCIIGIISNTLAVFSVKELPEEELMDESDKTAEDMAGFDNVDDIIEQDMNGAKSDKKQEKLTLVQSAKLLFQNKYYVQICVVYILQQLYATMINTGIYFMTYVLRNKNLYGVFSWAVNIPLIVALVFTPSLVAKFKGMYKLNKYSYMIATLSRLLVAVAGYMGSVPLMLLFTAVAALGQGPWQGDMNAVIASCSEYTYLRSGKRIDGTMYSCTSLGVKLGGGLGTAIAGWMLSLSGFVNGDASVQPDSCIKMMYFMFLWMPFIIDFIVTVILSCMNVEGANRKLKEEKNQKD
ncbi:MFS transporter [Eubacterium sp. MSJ-13]|uniref:MFS transporter n=1 Tax=Eubacterium sp. MSJ-13 TaxID=2841513 RepID=UPI001C103048|nr:MFS transporter [Eubacterium sp. MSJ-13]MBU5478456.1 MFS transporter [Eubacterium sp. MSJ-13]